MKKALSFIIVTVMLVSLCAVSSFAAAVEPAVVWDAAYLAEVGAPGGNQCDVNKTADYYEITVKSDADPFVALAGEATSGGFAKDAAVPGTAKYAVLIYQSTVSQSCEFFCGVGGAAGGGESEFFNLPTASDWARAKVDLTNGGNNSSWNDAANNNNFRFDLSAAGTVKIKAIYFFASADDAAAYADGSAKLKSELPSEVTPALACDPATLNALTTASDHTNNTTFELKSDSLSITATSSSDPHIYIALGSAEIPGAAKYAVLKYKSTAVQSCEFFCGTTIAAGGETDFFSLKETSEWAYVAVDLSKDGGNSAWSADGVNTYFRLDVSVEGTVDVAAIYFFTDMLDAEAAAAGATVNVPGTQPTDPESPETSDAAIVVIATVAVIALAGAVVLKKVNA